MKALILAAGFGSRLAPITDNLPKSLVSVNGKPILFKQIENLLSNNINDIMIISGYKSEILEKAVKEEYPNIQIKVSKEYATTNNMYSAYLGKEFVNNEPFLMMNADVFFDASVIQTLLSFESNDAIVVDIGNYLEESMKVVEENGKIIEISKQIPQSKALGASIDVYKFSKKGGQAFFEKCADYIENKKELKKWSEVALNDILSTQNFKACPLNGRWFEIDNHEDLAIAEKIFLK